MKQTAEAKVPFTRQEAKKCICWQCPVQMGSKCVIDNMAKVGDVLTTNYFAPEIIPALYCSSGPASCKDIDTKRSCICGDCAVYNDYRLGGSQPLDHYCKYGTAR